jgi:hypothetical protein
MVMDINSLKDTISKLEFMKAKAKSSNEAANLHTKIKILQKKLRQRYDND